MCFLKGMVPWPLSLALSAEGDVSVLDAGVLVEARRVGGSTLCLLGVEAGRASGACEAGLGVACGGLGLGTES